MDTAKRNDAQLIQVAAHRSTEVDTGAFQKRVGPWVGKNGGWLMIVDWFIVDKGRLGGGFKYFLMFIPIWGNDPIWLIFFRWVKTTNQPCFQPFSWNVIQGGYPVVLETGFLAEYPESSGKVIKFDEQKHQLPWAPQNPWKNKGLGHLKNQVIYHRNL